MNNFQFLFSNFQKRKGPGFTLIESVVAAAVFAVAMTAITAAVLAVMRVDQKSRAVRAVEQNARFVSEFIQRELRNGYLNYTGYPGGIVPTYGYTNELFIINAAGEQERVFLGANDELRLQKSSGGNNYETELTTGDVKVDGISFIIIPNQDPFAPGGPDTQPSVLYVFSLTSNTSTRERDRISIGVEGLVSLRNYPR